MEVTEKLKKCFGSTDSVNADVLIKRAEDLYWLYRIAKDNPKELETAFLLEANKLQKKVIEKLEVKENYPIE